MKVLFAVSNEEVSESIVKRYQKDYKEIISYKNVYYFNAILKELQKDKSYDRIVISEDLEAFSHTQYDQIDKFIFDRLDSISDEAINLNGEDIPIIIICADRRAKSEPMLSKFFGIGIYNALLGNDRSVEQVCKLIKKPRVKREAKNYYKIESEEVKYQPESENDVSEVEIQNILAHFKRLGNNEQKYIESFDSIAEQYNDAQLKVICKFLPLNVRATLEEMSPRYQKLVAYNKSVSNTLRTKKAQEDKGTTEKLLKPKTNEALLKKPVVIPSSVNMEGKKKLAKKPAITEKEEYKDTQNHNTEELKNVIKQENEIQNKIQEENQEEIKETKTKQYKDLFNNELVFVFIKVVENQKNIDIDNKFIKPIVDGLVLSKVIADDNIANMFYGVLGTTDKKKKPYTEVYVFKGEKVLEWIQNAIKTDNSKVSE